VPPIADAFKNAMWIDQQSSSPAHSNTIIQHPRSNDLDKQLEEEVQNDQGNETHL